MIQIRLLQPSDRKDLFNLVDKVDKDLVGMYTETDELVEDWINNIITGVWEIYVAIISREETLENKNRRRKLLPWNRKKNDIVGIVTLYGDWKEDVDIQKGEFDVGITVAEQFQKKGVGKELLSFIVKRGLELKYEKASLWTRADNLPMIKLALKSGFTQGSKRTRYGYKWINYYLELIKKKKEKKDPSFI